MPLKRGSKPPVSAELVPNVTVGGGGDSKVKQTPRPGLSRRGFFQLGAAIASAIGAASLGAGRKPAARAAQSEPAGDSYAMLIDLTLCVGCSMCAYACQEQNGWTGDPNGQELSADRWTAVREVALEGGDSRFVRTQCFHCQVPSCAEACIVGALRKTPEGPVVYDAGRCIGCRYCMIACPFRVPRYEWDDTWPEVVKCNFCAERIAQGQQPACAEACPTGATLFGHRSELIAEARRRIEEEPDRYVPHVYGVDEVGGTSWLFLSDVPFEKLGFPQVASEPPAYRTRAWMRMVPGLAVGMAGLLTTAYLLEGRNGGDGKAQGPDPTAQGGEHE